MTTQFDNEPLATRSMLSLRTLWVRRRNRVSLGGEDLLNKGQRTLDNRVLSTTHLVQCNELRGCDCPARQHMKLELFATLQLVAER